MSILSIQTPAQEAAHLLAQEHMSGAPVVDANGKVIGIVTADIVHAVAQGYLVIRPW